jgi:thioesterase domain-containing protein/acyl carrier protein
VVREPGGLAAETLRQWLGAKLPDYMVPALPLTPNGKVDRKALEKNDAVELASDTGYQAPRSQIERDLVEIWKVVLGCEKVGVRDNFFHLGGHSLTAVRLTGQVERVFGCKLPIAALFQSPTIEALARRLGEKDWEPPWSSLVPLRSQGKRPPIFFLHGVGGDVYGFLDLTQFLDPDQPAYGIQAVGLDGRLARHISVEDMASHYVQEIRSFQPVGPYYLSGYSMGGVIAYEVAQQLERGGQRVALLALLDSGPIGHVSWIFHVWRLAAYLPGRCLLHLRQWWGRPNRDRLDYLRGRWAALRYLTGHNRRAKKLVVTAPPTLQVKAPQILGFYDYYHAVAASYRIRRYPGKVDLFVSGNANPIWRHYWKYMARGGVSFHPVAGTHHQIFHSREHLAVLGESLMSALRRAQGKSTSRPAQGAGSNADFI